MRLSARESVEEEGRIPGEGVADSEGRAFSMMAVAPREEGRSSETETTEEKEGELVERSVLEVDESVVEDAPSLDDVPSDEVDDDVDDSSETIE